MYLSASVSLVSSGGLAEIVLKYKHLSNLFTQVYEYITPRLFWLSRWYASRFRAIAEKTDAGRVALPSVMKLMEGAFLDEGKATTRSTNEIWETSDRILSVCNTAWSMLPSPQ